MQYSRNVTDHGSEDFGRVPFLGIGFDPIDPDGVLARLARRPANAPFAYVVTPNVQHVVRADRDADIRPALDGAWLSLCDSRPVRRLARWSGCDLPLVTGSDLTVEVFARLLRPGDRVDVICASERLGAALAQARPDLRFQFHVPPADTRPGSPAFDACVRFVATSDARFCFVCLGAPKSERICLAAATSAGATGTALCTGAAIEFMLGIKRRAPRWMQRMGLEWVHRVLSEPRRLARRYVSAMVPLVLIWIREART